jgi:ATP-dependent protease ClpP protease subunit
MYEFDSDSGELFLYDAIGESVWGMIDAATVMKDLKSLGNRRATIRINSPGGSVDEGRAIYNAMKRHPGGVDTIIDSAGYSIAGYLFTAGERRLIAQNGMLMLHDPWTFAWGNASELRKAADVLVKYGESVLDAYAEASGKDKDEVRQIMAAETWYTSQEALDNGFATEIGDAILSEDKWHPMALAMRPKMTAKPEAGSRFQCSRPMRTLQFRK